jgi:transcriptional regulator of acetoin/glycerol metabolism
MSARHHSTQDHIEPERPETASAWPWLLAAYPRAAAFPLPASDEPVGRQWLADLGLNDGEVSTAHVRFVRVGGATILEDVGSKNGTWIDGHLVPPHEKVPVRDGALIRVGTTLLVHRQMLDGDAEPALPIGSMVGPFGLRRVAAAIETLRRYPPSNVLIEGETGTGKELAAFAIAVALGRERPYAAMNVAGVPEGVFESQLFGHVPGAFSGARQGALGILQAHEGGAVLLDEIGELPSELQPKLLRLLENREVLPVGADRPRHVEVLLIAATNRDLEGLVREGRFRHDLLARLSRARIHLPPLRDRIEDIPAIAAAVAPQVGASLREHVEIEAMEFLMLAPWPENVRGLIATLARLVAIDPKPGLRLWALEQILGPGNAPAPLSASVVDAALRACDGNESRAARRLGVSRGKLRRFLAQRER